MLLNAKPLLCKNLSAVSEDESALAHAYLNPNPADHSIRIENSSDQFQYIIYDLSGNSIMKDQIAANRTIDVSSFQPGMYMIKILNKGSSRIFKWIKS